MKTRIYKHAAVAFTLIELLVVIGIIAILAALLFPSVAMIKKRGMFGKARAELIQLSLAIDSYKAKMGIYPPDNPGKPMLHHLYYELLGTKSVAGTPGRYETLDGVISVSISDLQSELSTTVAGFMNCTRGSGDESTPAANYFRTGLKPGQYVELPDSTTPRVRILTCTVEWPYQRAGGSLLALAPNANPWRYNSSNPTNNPGSYDLWVDIYYNGKTNRISNWSDKPQQL